MILTDRSRIEADWMCPRKRYWLTEYDGGGIVPATDAPPLAFGKVVHTGIEAGIRYDGDDSLTIMETCSEWDTLSADQQDTAVAIVIGFFVTVWPEWMRQYEPMAVELELEWEQDGVLFMMRPDLLLKDKETGDIWYPDFKTFTSSLDHRKYTWSLQQQLTMLACEQALGVPLTGAWIQGLGKGSGRKGVLYHPLVYGYRHPGVPGVSEPTFGIKRRSGFERFNTKTYPHGGIKGWIQQLHKREPEMVAKIFPRSHPLFLNRHLMDQVLPHIIGREREIHHIKKEDIDNPRELFPMHITNCETGWGKCAYFDACHVPIITKDPVGSGSYQLRTPHHAAERKVWDVPHD